MWYIPKIDDYLKILTDEEVNDFVTISFNEYLREEKNYKRRRNSENLLNQFIFF